MSDSKFKELKPKVVLGIVAHPDDLDFGSSGTMAKFATQGAKVYYLILTDGSKGSEDKSITSAQLVKIRENEQKAALKILGGQEVFFLGYPDGQLEITMEAKKEVIKIIRKVKPDVVVTMDPSMIYSTERGYINHPDHRAAGQIALDAVFPLARDHLSFPELYDQGYEPHKTKTVLLINFDKANFYVDISSTFDTKIKALQAHASQIKDPNQTIEWIGQMAEMIGKRAGLKKAEGFVRLDLN